MTSSAPVPLNSILRDLRLRSGSYCRTEVGKPWGISIPYQDGVRFHFVVEGEGWLVVDGRAPLLMRTGDIVILPRGSGHVIADRPDRQPETVLAIGPQASDDQVYRLRTGGAGERSLIVCSKMSFGQPSHPLIGMMPATLHVRRADVTDSALPVLIDLMTSEVQEERIGWATVMARIADVIVTRAIRRWVDQEKGDVTGWLAASRDANIGRALAAIHEHPANLWSIGTLSAEAGLSRSVFHQRFADLLGVSPARYAANWRMHLASGWLSDDAMSVGQATAKLGYGSEAAFSRAFKRALGISPGAFRKMNKQMALPRTPEPAK